MVFADDSRQGEGTKILESINLQDVMVIWFAGMLGGLANSFVEKEGWGVDLLYNLILGGIAALVIYLMAGNELTPSKQVGAALLSGIGGGRIITNLKQRLSLASLGDMTERQTKLSGELSETIEKITNEGDEGYEERIENQGDENKTSAGNQSQV